MTRVVTDAEDAGKRVQRMLREFEWIASEQHLFNTANSDYDFEKQKPKAAAQRLADLKKEQEKLGKNINKKVMGMFEKAEQEYSDLLKVNYCVHVLCSAVLQSCHALSGRLFRNALAWSFFPLLF